jgi:hypothetical protein
MRKFVLIVAMIVASAAAAQAGDSRSLSTKSPIDTPASTNTSPKANDVIRADNATPAPAETPRYAPPAEPAPPADTARGTSDKPTYNARPAPVKATPPATTTARQPDYRTDRRLRGRRYAQAQRPHRHGRVSIRQIVAALHRHGIYW